MKKVFAILLSAAMMAVLLCACGKTEVSSSTVPSSEDSSSFPVVEEVDILENCNLSDEQMLAVIKNYYKVFEVVMNSNGDSMTFDVEENNGTVKVRAVREGQEPSVLEWDTVRSAYEFLYAQGQVDLEGNLLVTEESLINKEG